MHVCRSLIIDRSGHVLGCWRNIALILIGGLSAIAFHEKAGRSQVGSFSFLLDKVFLPAESPLSPPFHPHSW